MKKIIVSFSLILGMSFALFAQQNTTLEAKAQAYANEVFQDCNQYAQPAYIPSYVEVLSRMEVLTTTTYTSNNYVMLSTLTLKNKCNTNLTYDNASNFNPENFNPFKYFMDLYPKNYDKAYRVDGTNYIIVIHHTI